MIGRETAVVFWVPVLRRHDQVESVRECVGYRYDGVTIGHGECAIRHEVVLDVDKNERFHITSFPPLDLEVETVFFEPAVLFCVKPEELRRAMRHVLLHFSGFDDEAGLLHFSTEISLVEFGSEDRLVDLL